MTIPDQPQPRTVSDDSRGWERFLVRWAGAVLFAGFALGVLLHVQQLSSQLRQEAFRRLDLIDYGLVHEISRILQQSEAELGRVAANIAARPTDDPAALLADLRAASNGNPFLRDIVVVGPNGRILAGLIPEAIGQSVADYDFFQIQSRNRLFLGRPKAGRDFAAKTAGHSENDAFAADGFITLSRRLGGDRSLIVATIGTDSLINILRARTGADTVDLALYRFDGALLVATTPTQEPKLPDNPIFSQYMPDRESGQFVAADGSLVVFRATEDFPLIVVVRQPAQETRSRFVNALLPPAIALTGVSVVVLLYTWLWRRAQRRIDEALEILSAERQRRSLALRGADLGTWDHVIAEGSFITSDGWYKRITGSPNPPCTTYADWLDQIHPTDRPLVEIAFQNHRTGRADNIDVTYRLVRYNGSWAHVQTRGQLVETDRKGQPLRMAGTHRDLSEVHRTRSQLDLAATVYANTAEGIVVTDPENIIISVNPMFTKITGFLPEDVIGKNPRILSSGQQDSAFYRDMWLALGRNGHWSGEIWNRRKTGESFPEWLRVSAVRDEQGRIINYIGQFSDLTEKRKIEERMSFLAHHDSLTGLPNRRALEDHLRQQINRAKRANTRIAVLYADLDHFKVINDSLGHAAGDELLREATRRLGAVVETQDSIGRLGSDEFVVVVPDLTEATQSIEIADRLIASLTGPFRIDGQTIEISASIGIAVYPNDGVSESVLLANASTAMHAAKDDGRARYHIFNDAIKRRAVDRQRIEVGLRQALRQNELLLHLQPQFDLTTRRLVGAEALIRWQRPREGMIAPNQFIPIAEATGLILPIGDWVLFEACQIVRRLRHAGCKEFRLAINVSAMQLDRGELPARFAEAMARAQIPADALEIEITESALMAHAESNLAITRALKDMGLRLAIDDFGTGYSSLAYLKRFPIDLLKIDRSFIHDLPHDSADAQIVGAVVSMAKALGIATLAEGVENDDQAEILAGLGVDMVQGFGFGHPTPEADFLTKFLITN